MHPPSAPESARCYLQIKFLPKSCQPAYVVRHRGVTLVAVDPRSSRDAVYAWVTAHLTVDERNVYRAAYNTAPIPTALGDRWVNDLPYPMVVPKRLQLPTRGSAWRERQVS